MHVQIPARSRRQAWDWSLALISQGIENTIECDTDTGWFISVEAEHGTRAHETIERFQAENRGWSWQQSIQPDVLFDWAAAGWVLLMVLFYSLQTNSPEIAVRGMMSSAAASQGELWRLVTATCLHADLSHLMTNVTIGLLLLGLVMGRFGTGVGMLAALLAGAGGNLATWWIFPEHRSLGASGVVLGCVGLLAAQAFSFQKHRASLKYAVTGLIAGAMLFVLLGLDPRSDVLAHFGGFVAGVILGTGLLLLRLSPRSGRVNAICAALSAALVLAAWAWALR